MFANFGNQVRNGNAKIAKIGLFAILGKQVRNGNPKIAKLPTACTRMHPLAGGR